MNVQQWAIFLVLVTMLMLFEAVAMSMLTAYSRDRGRGKGWKLVIGVLLYGILVPVFLLYGLQFTGIAVVNLMWNIMTTIVMILIGYVLFEERVNVLHLVSLCLAIAAGGVLYLADQK